MEKEDRRANVCRRNSPGPGQEAQEKKILSLCIYIPGATGTSCIFFFSPVGAQIPVDSRLSPYPCILVNIFLSDWSYN